MKLGSLFDGSGGFPLAGSLCGIEPVWAAEVEPYPIAVTRSRFPSMRHLGDISKVDGSKLEPVDIITFGSPRQDLSVAGKQAGIKHTDSGDDETTRSGLFMEAARIIKEMREATHGLYPRFALWENVPGAFSSNSGEDFRTVLEELIRIPLPGAVMPPVPRGGWAYADSYTGDGWSLAYRVFDAQYWGVPQRRRRIHLVLDLRGECAREVLFEREGLRGYFAQSGAQGQGVAPDAAGSPGADDHPGTGAGADGGLDAVSPGGLLIPSASGHPDGLICMATQQGNAEIRADNKAPTLTAAAGMSGNNQPVIALAQSQPSMKQQTFIVDNFGGQAEYAAESSVSPTLKATHYKGAPCVTVPAAGLDVIDRHILDDQGGSVINVRTDGKSPTLRAQMGGPPPCVMVFGGASVIPIHDQATRFEGKRGNKQDGKGNGLGVGAEGDPMNTLTAADRHCVAYGIGNGQANQSFSENLVGALNCMHDQQAVAYGINGDVAGTLDASYYKGCGMRQGIEREVVAVPVGDADPIVFDKEVYQSGINATGGHYISEGGPAPTLRTTGHPPGVSYGVDCRNATETPELNGTLQAKPNGGFSMNCNQIVRTQYIVRRLTPTECARLQGFADCWGHIEKKESFTDAEWCFWSNVRNTHAAINGRAVKSYTKAQMLTWYNKLHTDSAEYKMWGNGIALPPALYCMQGMADVLNRTEDDSWLL